MPKDRLTVLNREKAGECSSPFVHTDDTACFISSFCVMAAYGKVLCLFDVAVRCGRSYLIDALLVVLVLSIVQLNLLGIYMIDRHLNPLQSYQQCMMHNFMRHMHRPPSALSSY
jgi:hypothetical protein